MNSLFLITQDINYDCGIHRTAVVCAKNATEALVMLWEQWGAWAEITEQIKILGTAARDVEKGICTSCIHHRIVM